MGLVLSIQTDIGQKIPYSLSDRLKSQLLTFGISDEPLTKIAHTYHLDLTLITGYKIVGKDDETLEDFLARDPDDKERGKYWYDDQARREKAWQSPQVVLNTTLSLVKILSSQKDVFTNLQIESEYFTKGIFLKDLELLVKSLEWCIENNIQKIRFTIG